MQARLYLSADGSNEMFAFFGDRPVTGKLLYCDDDRTFYGLRFVGGTCTSRDGKPSGGTFLVAHPLRAGRMLVQVLEGGDRLHIDNKYFDLLSDDYDFEDSHFNIEAHHYADDLPSEVLYLCHFADEPDRLVVVRQHNGMRSLYVDSTLKYLSVSPYVANDKTLVMQTYEQTFRFRGNRITCDHVAMVPLNDRHYQVSFLGGSVVVRSLRQDAVVAS